MNADETEKNIAGLYPGVDNEIKLILRDLL